jgi:hypothetical protein
MLIYNRLGWIYVMSRQRGPEETARKLHSAALHLMRYVRAQDTALGVPPAQLSALSVVVFGGKKSLSEVDKMDRRSVVITATDKGVRIMHEGRSRREKRLLELLGGLTRDEIDLLDRASETLTKSLAAAAQ